MNVSYTYSPKGRLMLHTKYRGIQYYAIMQPLTTRAVMSSNTLQELTESFIEEIMDTRAMESHVIISRGTLSRIRPPAHCTGLVLGHPYPRPIICHSRGDVMCWGDLIKGNMVSSELRRIIRVRAHDHLGLSFVINSDTAHMHVELDYPTVRRLSASMPFSGKNGFLDVIWRIANSTQDWGVVDLAERLDLALELLLPLGLLKHDKLTPVDVENVPTPALGIEVVTSQDKATNWTDMYV